MLLPTLPRTHRRRAGIAFDGRWLGYCVSEPANGVTIIALALGDFALSLLQIAYDILREQCGPHRYGSGAEGLPNFRESPVPPLVRLLDWSVLIITGAFVLEMLLQGVAFGGRYFDPRSRYGLLHVLDLIVVVVSFALALYTAGSAARLASVLIVLRLWRVVNLVSTAETALEGYGDLGSAHDRPEAEQPLSSSMLAREVSELRRRLRLQQEKLEAARSAEDQLWSGSEDSDGAEDPIRGPRISKGRLG
ncbi:hypothetical protein JCM8202v2_001722 [Rhodotorula sphaerocarpa]